MTADGQQDRDDNGYPSRPRFWMCRLIQQLWRSDPLGKQGIGRHAFGLVVYIAHVEDSTRYEHPVSFWNDQLMQKLGLTSPKQLAKARQRAIDRGWLKYWREHKRAIGYYYTMIPEDLVQSGDSDSGCPVIGETSHSSTGKEKINSHSSTGKEKINSHSSTGKEKINSHSFSRSPRGKPSCPVLPYYYPSSTSPNTTSHACATPKADGGDAEMSWNDLEARLARLGVVATRRLRERTRLSPEEASHVIDHYEREQRWKPSALYHRLRDGATGLAPAEGWLPDDPELAQRAAEKRRRKAERIDDIWTQGKQQGKTPEEIATVLANKGLPPEELAALLATKARHEREEEERLQSWRRERGWLPEETG